MQETHGPTWQEVRLYKTSVCRNFVAHGRCEFADNCGFAHGVEELRQKPDLNQTVMCKAVAEAGFCAERNCRSAHSKVQLHGSRHKWKTCNFNHKGRCKHGPACRFAHSYDEYRQAYQVPVKAGDTVETSRTSDGTFKSKEYDMTRLMVGKQDSLVLQPLSETLKQSSGDIKNGKQSQMQKFQPSQLDSGRQPNSARSSDQNTEGLGAREVSSTLNRKHSEDFFSWTSSSCTKKAPGNEHMGNLPMMRERKSSSDVRATNKDLSDRTVSAHLACDEFPKTMTVQSPEWGRITTLFITSVPTYLTHGALLSILEDNFPSMRWNYDFYYCPWDEQHGHKLGFVFLNFPDPNHAMEFQQHFTKHPVCRAGHGQRLLRVLLFSIQGLEANLEYFSHVEITSCSDMRFCPLYRDTNFRMQPLPLQVSAQSGDFAVPSWAQTAVTNGDSSSSRMDEYWAVTGANCATVVASCGVVEQEFVQSSSPNGPR